MKKFSVFRTRERERFSQETETVVATVRWSSVQRQSTSIHVTSSHTGNTSAHQRTPVNNSTIITFTMQRLWGMTLHRWPAMDICVYGRLLRLWTSLGWPFLPRHPQAIRFVEELSERSDNKLFSCTYTFQYILRCVWGHTFTLGPLRVKSNSHIFNPLSFCEMYLL